MRELKFRAWDKTSDVMRTDISSIRYNHDGSINQIDVESGVDILFPDKEAVLMQYTGLKDKNGKEIYEGDIVRWHYGKNTERRVVEWITDEAMFRPNDMDKDPPVEVIGNIYQNPELLNG